MYYEHPFKIDGVYYAKIDGELIEITEELARAMLKYYRKDKRYIRRWMPDLKSKEEQKKEDEALREACGDLLTKIEEELRLAKDEKSKQTEESKSHKEAPVKPKRKDFRRELILDCVFRENTDGVTVEDMAATDYDYVEQQVIKTIELEILRKKLSLLSEEDRYLIDAVYFRNIPQVELAKAYGISPQAMSYRMKYVRARLRNLYTFEN